MKAPRQQSLLTAADLAEPLATAAGAPPEEESDLAGTPPWVMVHCVTRYGGPLDGVTADQVAVLQPRGALVMVAGQWWGFELDAFSQPSMAKAIRIYTRQDNAFRRSWRYRCVFANPPYSSGILGPAVARAREAVDTGETGRACLVIPDTPGVAWHGEQVVRPSAVHVAQRFDVVRDDRRDRRVTVDLYVDGEVQVEVTRALGRVCFTRPDGSVFPGSGRQEIAVVVFSGPGHWLEKSPTITPGALRGRRVALGYTQGGLAKALGVSQALVAAWEAGKREPTLRAIAELARLPAAQASGRGPYRGAWLGGRGRR